MGLSFLLLVMAAIIYFDDIQLVGSGQQVPTIFNLRIAGIKALDLVSAGLMICLAMYLLIQGSILWTRFHTWVAAMFAVYVYAGLVGLVYSFPLRYDYAFWVQDLQQTIYMAGFFLLVFYFVDTKPKWNLFVSVFVGAMALKNLIILYRSLTGVGKVIGDWAFRASQNSEFAYFPMMFFPIVLLFLWTRSWWRKGFLAALLVVYLFNSLLGIYRTVWVMLIAGIVFLMFQLDGRSRLRLSLWMGVSLAGTLAVISVLFPRFLELAWSFKFASIFDWSVYGDRSNSTRILEIVNVVNHVFGNFAFLHGMGLGAWWDDSARRLLPDFGSGFTYKTRFHGTHMWYLTQLLKLGAIGLVVYWYALYRIFRTTGAHLRTMSWSRWDKHVLLGLQVGLLCAFVSSADFVRLFLMVGVNIALCARLIVLDSVEPPLRIT